MTVLYSLKAREGQPVILGSEPKMTVVVSKPQVAVLAVVVGGHSSTTRKRSVPHIR